MTYAQFLLVFLFIPLLVMVFLTFHDERRQKRLPPSLRNLPILGPILVHVLIAVIYTTPWDNYLVATGVWYYDPDLVAGITIGWVPIEEYTFFVLQTLLSGLWLVFWGRRLKPDCAVVPDARVLRRNATLVLGTVWLASVVLLFSGWRQGIYLGLILAWALPPIMLQLAFGADLLWKHRGLVFLSITTTTLYLALTDSLAIDGGTWTIDSQQSLNLFLGGVLPLEELVFFLVTNVLITFGITLVLTPESRLRARSLARFPFPRLFSNRRDENYS